MSAANLVPDGEEESHVIPLRRYWEGDLAVRCFLVFAAWLTEQSTQPL